MNMFRHLFARKETVAEHDEDICNQNRRIAAIEAALGTAPINNTDLLKQTYVPTLHHMLGGWQIPLTTQQPTITARLCTIERQLKDLFNCPECQGAGKHTVMAPPDADGDVLPVEPTQFTICTRCNGTGRWQR